jgi:hypothetical protein
MFSHYLGCSRFPGGRRAIQAQLFLAAYTAYVAYFGTYTVDPEKRVVTHHVEGSLAPDFTHTDQPRPFKLEGDRMEIGDGKTWQGVR